MKSSDLPKMLPWSVANLRVPGTSAPQIRPWHHAAPPVDEEGAVTLCEWLAD